MFGAISQTFGRAFLVAHLVPSGILCAALLLAMRLGLVDKTWAANLKVFGADRGVLVLIVIFGVAAVLSVVSKLIMRLYEGYNPRFFFGLAVFMAGVGVVTASVTRHEWQPRSPFEVTMLLMAIAAAIVAGLHPVGVKYHVYAFNRDQAALDGETDRAERGRRKYRFSRSYPDRTAMRPTRFGNVLRAFEYYPSRMFGIDPITIWFRLVAVIPAEYRAAIEQAEATTQFFLNCSLVAIILAGVSTYVSLSTRHMAWTAVAVALLAGAYLLYRLACTVALDWGEHVRGAFDLYRFDLLKQLGVSTPEPSPWSLAVERGIWARTQRATFYANPDAQVCYAPAGRTATSSPAQLE